jgi:pimeloyl-ACP methyl ester carboxylesterase
MMSNSHPSLWSTRPSTVVRLSAALVLLAATICAATILATTALPREPATLSRPPAARLPRILVIVVPGTFGNTDLWPGVVLNQATFGSEIARAIGPNCDVYPFLWSSSVSHQSRMDAAHQLARLIEEKARVYDKIHLVGHSHGGNIALAAVGQSKVRVDHVVCLSTPHPHFRVRAADGVEHAVPVYASREAVANCTSITAITPDADRVPDRWSNELLIGLSEAQAIGLTAGWRENLSHPRLLDDGIWVRLFETGSVIASPLINLHDRVHNISYQSAVKDRWGIKPHHAVHSRRMGFVVGSLLRDGPTATQIEYIQTLIQPEDADFGEPLDIAEHLKWVDRHADRFIHRGWRLKRLTVTATPEWPGGDLDSSPPDLYAILSSVDGKREWKRTQKVPDSHTATWETDYFIKLEERDRLEVFDKDLMRSTSLGAIELDPENLPEAIEASPATGRYFAVKFEWTRIHW